MLRAEMASKWTRSLKDECWDQLSRPALYGRSLQVIYN